MSSITIFLCGDVMTGRGIDQIFRFPSDSAIHESYITDAKDYVRIAESAHGPIPRSVSPQYVWGDAITELEQVRPVARIINLETSITTSRDWQPKGINYRMHPKNVGCLTTAKIDCCALANNHILDWGRSGLTETCGVLRSSGIQTAGVGENLVEAQTPAIIEVPAGRVIVFSVGSITSGIPIEWAASNVRAGVNFLCSYSHHHVREIKKQVNQVKRPGDVAVLSIHWGDNWGYEVSNSERQFARCLIDEAGIDIVHGHSSHHVKGLEVHNGKLILFGCGDLITDYEGIEGFRGFRGDLGLMYFVTVEPSSGTLVGLEMIPVQQKRFRLGYPSRGDCKWLFNVLEQESRLATYVLGQSTIGWRNVIKVTQGAERLMHGT